MTQSEIISQMASLSEPGVRGVVEADASDVPAHEGCSNGDGCGPGTICGPEWFGYELGPECAARAVEQWLRDPEHGPREVLSLEVLAS